MSEDLTPVTETDRRCVHVIHNKLGTRNSAGAAEAARAAIPESHTLVNGVRDRAWLLDTEFDVDGRVFTAKSNVWTSAPGSEGFRVIHM